MQNLNWICCKATSKEKKKKHKNKINFGFHFLYNQEKIFCLMMQTFIPFHVYGSKFFLHYFSDSKHCSLHKESTPA